MYRQTTYDEINLVRFEDQFNKSIINLAKQKLTTHKKICDICKGKSIITENNCRSYTCDKCEIGYVYICLDGYSNQQLFELCMKLQNDLDNCKNDFYKKLFWADHTLKEINRKYNLPCYNNA